MTWGALGILGEMFGMIRNHFDVIDRGWQTHLWLSYNQYRHVERKEHRKGKKRRKKECRYVCSSSAVKPLCLSVLPLPKLTISSKCYLQIWEAVFIKGWRESALDKKTGIDTQVYRAFQQLSEQVTRGKNWFFRRKKKESRQIERGHMDTVCNRISGRGIFFFFSICPTEKVGRLIS